MHTRFKQVSRKTAIRKTPYDAIIIAKSCHVPQKNHLKNNITPEHTT
jgi:hypothetical protein